jgi:hypothetical protein
VLTTTLEHLLDQERFEEWFEIQLQKAPADCDIPAHLRPPADVDIHEYLRVGRIESANGQSRSRSSSPDTVIGIDQALPPAALSNPGKDKGVAVCDQSNPTLAPSED